MTTTNPTISATTSEAHDAYHEAIMALNHALLVADAARAEVARTGRAFDEREFVSSCRRCCWSATLKQAGPNP